MAPGQKPQDQKIIETLEAIKLCSWCSTNQFIQAFYTSSEATQSLQYQPDSAYGPEHVMTAWMANVPSGNAKDKLHLSITCMSLQSSRNLLNGLWMLCGVFSWMRGCLVGVDIPLCAFLMLIAGAYYCIHSSFGFCHAISVQQLRF